MEGYIIKKMFIRTVFISFLVCLTFQINSVFWADLSRNNPIHIIGLGKYVVLADGGLYNAYEQKNIESFVYSATSTNTKTYVVGEYGVYIFENKLSFIEISFYPNPYKKNAVHEQVINSIVEASGDSVIILSQLSKIDKTKVKRAIKSSDQIFDYGRLRDIDKQWVDLLIGN